MLCKFNHLVEFPWNKTALLNKYEQILLIFINHIIDLFI